VPGETHYVCDVNIKALTGHRASIQVDAQVMEDCLRALKTGFECD
jgi:hypothetical protein